MKVTARQDREPIVREKVPVWLLLHSTDVLLFLLSATLIKEKDSWVAEREKRMV